MISKMWAALGICAALMVGGVSVVAAGSMNGDCLQDQLQLKDGTGDNCPCAEELLAPTNDTCDGCMDYNWSFLYGETDLAPPHQSCIGQESEYLLVALTSDGVCEPTLNSYFYQFLFGETDLEPPYQAHAGQAQIV